MDENESGQIVLEKWNEPILYISVKSCKTRYSTKTTISHGSWFMRASDYLGHLRIDIFLYTETLSELNYVMYLWNTHYTQIHKNWRRKRTKEKPKNNKSQSEIGPKQMKIRNFVENCLSQDRIRKGGSEWRSLSRDVRPAPPCPAEKQSAPPSPCKK